LEIPAPNRCGSIASNSRIEFIVTTYHHALVSMTELDRTWAQDRVSFNAAADRIRLGAQHESAPEVDKHRHSFALSVAWPLETLTGRQGFPKKNGQTEVQIQPKKFNYVDTCLFDFVSEHKLRQKIFDQPLFRQ
jgi:hypothetical protein